MFCSINVKSSVKSAQGKCKKKGPSEPEGLTFLYNILLMLKLCCCDGPVSKQDETFVVSLPNQTRKIKTMTHKHATKRELVP